MDTKDQKDNDQGQSQETEDIGFQENNELVLIKDSWSEAKQEPFEEEYDPNNVEEYDLDDALKNAQKAGNESNSEVNDPDPNDDQGLPKTNKKQLKLKKLETMTEKQRFIKIHNDSIQLLGGNSKDKDRHMMLGQYVEMNTETGLEQCKVCQKSYKGAHRSTRTRQLFDHIERKHLKLRSYVCEYCGHTFNSKTQKASHISLKHREEHKSGKPQREGPAAAMKKLPSWKQPDTLKDDQNLDDDDEMIMPVQVELNEDEPEEETDLDPAQLVEVKQELCDEEDYEPHNFDVEKEKQVEESKAATQTQPKSNVIIDRVNQLILVPEALLKNDQAKTSKVTQMIQMYNEAKAKKKQAKLEQQAAQSNNSSLGHKTPLPLPLPAGIDYAKIRQEQKTHPCTICKKLYKKESLRVHLSVVHGVKKRKNESLELNEIEEPKKQPKPKEVPDKVNRPMTSAVNSEAWINLRKEEEQKSKEKKRIYLPNDAVPMNEDERRALVEQYIENNSETGQEQCKVCQKSYKGAHRSTRVRQLHDHIERSHLKLKSHMCEYCGQGFNSRGQKACHISMKHNQEHKSARHTDKLIKQQEKIESGELVVVQQDYDPSNVNLEDCLQVELEEK